MEPLSWNWLDIWGRTDWVSHTVFVLLTVFLIQELIILIERHRRYSSARRKSVGVVDSVISVLEQGRVDDALNVALSHRRSHIAEVLSAGVEAFRSALAMRFRGDVFDSVDRAVRRRQTMVRIDLSHGTGTLATLAYVAPLVGIIGTVSGILNVFRGGSGSRASWLEFESRTIADALMLAGFGLLVAVVAAAFHNHLVTRVSHLDAEMTGASLRLMHQFTGSALVFENDNGRHLRAGEIPSTLKLSPDRHSEWFLVSAWTFGFYVVLRALMTAQWR